MSTLLQLLQHPYIKKLMSAARKTNKGVRLDLSLYTYEKGHGYFAVKGHDPLPIGDSEQAEKLFKLLWEALREEAR
jgi:hypothetical protein